MRGTSRGGNVSRAHLAMIILLLFRRKIISKKVSTLARLLLDAELSFRPAFRPPALPTAGKR
jgi:hypothetical protein